ncbi:hypothetical protein [Gordonia alkaliphila]|uniref:Uncharacterized protein n=1 Tax=Gordonia alkaliphila TaxID=1053547 RepID=A0ABP8ZJD3_9ACTN
MADLIESVLNAGVYPAPSINRDQSDEAPSPDVDPRRHRGEQLDAEAAPLALSHGAAALLSTSVLPVAPPPALVDGTGRELLGLQRAMAARLDPDLERILNAAPRVAAW